MRIHHFIIAIALAAACDDPSSSGSHPVTIDRTHVIAGGSFLIHSQDLRASRPNLIAIDTFEMQQERVNDTTLRVRIAPKARGALNLTVNGRTVGVLNVAGFISYRPRTTDITGNPRRFPFHGPVSLIAGTDDRAVVQFIPATGEIRTLLTGYWLDNANTRSAGPTPDPSVFLLQPVGSDSLEPWFDKPLEAWNLSGVPSRVRSFRRQSNHRVLAQLNDSVFLLGTHHFVQSYKMANGSQHTIYMGTYEETNDIVLSPRKDRAAIRVHGSPTGPPVFDMLTGDTVYHIRSVRGAEGVAFSSDGDTLFVLGYINHDRDSKLLVLDAASGQELSRIELPYWVEDLAFDPATSIAYLGVTQQVDPLEPGALRVLVLDVVTMQIIGEMSAHESRSFPCFYRNIFVGTDGVFFVCGGDTWRFDRVTN